MLKLTETHKESKVIVRKIKQQEGTKIDDFAHCFGIITKAHRIGFDDIMTKIEQ